MQSTTDTEVILHLVARSRRNRFVDRFIDALRAARRRLLAGRAHQQEADRRARSAGHPPAGARRARRRPILASETCALDIIGAQFVRDVEHGEIVVFDEDGTESHQAVPGRWRRGPASSNTSISRDRIRSSAAAPSTRSASAWASSWRAKRRPTADVVVPVPDSGVPAALGFAQAAGIPFELGIIRNHYVGRTFIQPTQAIREIGVRLKHNANRAVVAGKRIMLIDDQLVRGTTSVKIVQMMRDAGAKRGAFPHRLAADHPSRLLRHRHARARQAARRHPRRWRNAAVHRRRLARLPVGRGHLPGHGRGAAAIRPAAVHRPLLHRRVSDRADRPDRRTRRSPRSCRCSPKRADAFRHGRFR